MSVTLEDIRQTAARIQPLIHRTPVMQSRLFNEAAGVEAYFKCENLQRTGSFKMRGAANFLCRLTPAERERGVVAYSSGNHAQAVARGAQHFRIRAAIVMPQDAPAVKIAATRSYGATVVTYDRFSEDREEIGRQIAAETQAAIIPPFDHEWILEGQGTAALELLENVPDLDALAVCVGGGGLLSGCATVARETRGSIRVFGVEPELANDTYLSLQQGKRIRIPMPDTIADGLRAPQPGAVTFPLVQRLVESILLVTEEQIQSTMQFIASRMKLVAEPSGAVAAAAVLNAKLPRGIRRIGILISGGNV